MSIKKILRLALLLVFAIGQAQTHSIGFKTLKLTDSSRTFKPGTDRDDPLHFRPVELDIWYPGIETKGNPMVFEDLFRLFEDRAVKYQDEEDYSGMTSELAQFYVAELGVGAEGDKLLEIKTKSYADLEPKLINEDDISETPLILYLAGFNGMGFENYRVIEELVEQGYVVAAIWSVGKYPGNMTNEKKDMMEQVLDAEFALKHLKQDSFFRYDPENIGVLGCSWGGMSAGVLVNRNPEIKAFVSLDGTETHYFGEEEQNDIFIQEIYDEQLLAPEKQKVSYLYFESGDKWEEFEPTRTESYYQELDSDKYYMRFTNSKHADFSCIPYILNATPESVSIYEDIQKTTLSFFDKTLRGQSSFEQTWLALKEKPNTEDLPLDFSKPAEGQTEFYGTITDKGTGSPLAYVNIGVLNRERGTVSDSEGKFSLELPESFINDTLRISSIGYEPVDILVRNLHDRKPLDLSLEEDVGELNEIIIPVKGYKNKTLGNKTQSRFMGTGFGYDQLGAEMGVKINIRHEPTFVDAFNFFISYNRLSGGVVFRLNFYSVKRGKPDQNLLNRNILVTIEPKQTGSIQVDLTPYDIVLTEDVIVTLEWVDNIGENIKGEAIFFSLAILNSGTIYKRSSQARFKKYSNLGVGFNIDVRY